MIEPATSCWPVRNVVFGKATVAKTATPRAVATSNSDRRSAARDQALEAAMQRVRRRKYRHGRRRPMSGGNVEQCPAGHPRIDAQVDHPIVTAFLAQSADTRCQRPDERMKPPERTGD